MALSELEEALLGVLKSALGNVVRVVGALPGELDEEMLRLLAMQAPGVYLYFAGGRALGQPTPVLDGRWMTYVINTHASGAEQRRTGDGVRIGVFQLVEAVAACLHQRVFQGHGMARLERVEVLWNGRLERHVLTVYVLTWAIPTDISLAEDTQSDLQRIHIEYDLGPNEVVDAIDEVTQ